MLEIINNILTCAMPILTLYIFGKLVLQDDNKYINKDKIIIILISIAIHTIIFLLLDGTIKTVLLCLLFTMMLKTIFNISYTKSLFASIIYTVMLIFPNLIVMSIATLLFKISVDFFLNYIAGNILGSVLVSLVMILIIYILKKPLKILFSQDLSSNKKIIAVSSLALITLAIFFYHLVNVYKLNNNIYGCAIIIVTLILILFYLFKQKINNNIIIKRYDDLLSIMKSYESDVEEQREIIHETRNELMTIRSKISDKVKAAEIIKYIDSVLGDKVSVSMSRYSKFKYLPSNGIKGFFYYKLSEAEKQNIKISVNISKQIEKSFLGSLNTRDFKDLVRMIGVYLDNAIEASAESKEKKLGLEIYLIKEDIEIIISNTYNNNLNLDKIGKEHFTTKGKNHGYGLLLVKKILNNNKIFKSTTDITDNLYIQKLKIKNEK